MAVPANLTACKPVVIQVHFAALVGDEVQSLFHQPGEQLAVVATPIEDHREALVSQYLTYFGNDLRQALGQVAAHLFGHHQQWPATHIVDEVLHDAWQWHATVRVPHLGHQSGAVVILDVAIDVQIVRLQQTDFHPMPRQQRPETRRLTLLTELVQFAT